jgi:ABC-type multidrug transport system ATPase subunit
MLSQYDNFFDMLTPRETLEFAYYLESIKKKTRMPQQQKRQQYNNHTNIVEKKLSSLGLLGVADRRIGDPIKMDSGSSGRSGSRHFFGVLRSKLFGIRGGSTTTSSSGGLSGGERRRLSVALELISTEPRLFLADEPTTGLDSSQAYKVIQIIHTITKEWNVPTLCTLHQPKTSIYKLLDNVILLGPGGKVCYCGLAGYNATNYFRSLGYDCPIDVNPAEFLIDLVTIDTDDIHQAIIDESRINYLHEQFLQTCSSSSSTISSTGMPMIRNDGSTRDRSRRVSTLGIINRVQTTMSNGIRHTMKRFTLLLLRSWRQNIRNKKVILVRLCAVIVQAYLFSTIFASVQDGKSIPKSLADRIALLTYGVINLSMMSLMKSLDLFAKERRVVQREQMRSSYTSLEYIVAKVIAEIPLDASFALVFAAVLKTLMGLRTSMITLIKTYCLMTVTCATLGFAIGSFTSSVESAMTTGISVIVVLMVVGVINPSGVNLDDGPPNQIMQILGFFSPIKWAIESLVTAEFSGMIFEDDSTNKHNSRGLWGRLQDLPKMGALAFVKNGNDVLANLGLGKATYTELMTHLCLLSGIYLTISWIGLSFFRPTFI